MDIVASDGITKIMPLGDSKNRVLVTESFYGEKQNNGLQFSASDYDSDIDISGPKYWSIRTPNTTKYAHMVISLSASAAGILEIFENPNLGSTGAIGEALTSYNGDRNSSTAATTLVYYDATVSGVGASDGTKIYNEYIIDKSKDKKFILKKNEDYLVKFTSIADNNKASVGFEWVEHVNS
jgi:hypothetical protein